MIPILRVVGTNRSPVDLSLVKGLRSGGLARWRKTGTAVVANSFWGAIALRGIQRGFSENWNMTTGKLEVTALAHNHSLPDS